MKNRKQHRVLHVALTVVYILSSFSSILTYLFMTAPPAEAAWSVTVTSRLMKNDGTLFGSNASISGHQIALVCPRNPPNVYLGGYTTSTATNSHTWTGIQNSVASCDAGSIAPYQITEANGYVWTRVQASPDNKHRYPTASNNNITIDWDYNPPTYRTCPDGTQVPWAQTCPVPPVLTTTTCDNSAWYIQNGWVAKMNVDTQAGQLAQINYIRNTNKDMNAAAYHPSSQYFYAIDRFGGDLYKFDSTGNINNMGVVLPALNPNGGVSYTAGDIGLDGKMYVLAVGSNVLYKIDVLSSLAASGRKVGQFTQAESSTGTPLSKTLIFDVAVSPVDGKLYGFDRESNKFARMSTTTGGVEFISTNLGPQGLGTDSHGAAWFWKNASNQSVFYNYQNGTSAVSGIGGNGAIYRIVGLESRGPGNLLNSSNYGGIWKQAPFTNTNDAAMCSGASEPPPDICPYINGVLDPTKQTTMPAGYQIDPNNSQNCILIPVPYYPWLQTDKGDVTSTTGSITGQRYGPVPFSGDPLGGKHYTTNQYNPSEAYGVVTAALGGSNFCSQNLYALASSSSNRSNCVLSNYGSTSIDTTALGTAIDTAYNKNGAGASPVNGLCNPYNTSSSGVFNSNLSLGCIDGGIQKIASNYTMPAATGLTGRGTLWIVGNLTINSNITYGGAVGTSTDLKSLPNLGIYVTGDVIIDPSVTQIDAMIVASGKISTCSTSSNAAANNCTLPLSVNGSFASIGSSIIDFGRRYYSTSINSPAEKLTLTPQSVIFPPPGFNKGDANFESQLRFNSTELQPRLK